MTQRFKFTAAAVLVSVFLLISAMAGSGASAAGFPDKAINMVVPYNPGGGSDIICRMMDKFAKDTFGNNFIFVYKPGAGGAVGSSVIARSAADGYTIGTVNIPHFVLQSLTGSGDYTIDSFDYLGQVASDPQVLVTPGNSPIKTLEAFIAEAKANPGKMTVGVPGALGAGHIAAYMLMDKAGIEFTVVPYGGGADLSAALLGGQIDAAVHQIGIVAPEKDQMNLLAVSHHKRHAFLPDTPTFKELGYEVNSFIGRLIVAPKGLSPEVLKTLRDGLKAIWDKPEYQDGMNKANFSVDWMSGDELEAYLKDYVETSKALLEKYFKK